MYALGKLEPVTIELIPARGDNPAVTATFNAQPSALSLRAGRRAVAQILNDGQPRTELRAGEAFAATLVRHNILSWTGIGEVGSGDDTVLPTHDREIRDAAGEIIGVEPGTISRFIAEPRLMEAADLLYVLPWSLSDAEKNAYAPSPNGTSEGATPAEDIAGKPATSSETDDAPSAPTKPKRPGAKKAKPSGS